MQLNFWHWPDHNIGKRESRRLREEHNAAMNLNAELVNGLEMAEKVFNVESIDPLCAFMAIEKLRSLIQKAKANQ